MKKDVAKTCILVCSTLAIMLIIFLIVGNVKYGVELLTRNTLIENDPTVSILFERVNGNTKLRRSSIENNKLTSEEKIKYILETLSKDDYEISSIKPQKIVCEVNDKISFNANDGKCKLMIVKNEIFMEYQKKYFGIEDSLEYIDFTYHGKECKNDGNKYYCLLDDYKDYVLGYSVFDEAYSEKDKVVIREYYLQIDAENEKRCNKYFKDGYCDNYINMDKPEIDNDIVKKDGILYEHVFKESDSNYYLEKSFIVAER